MFAAHRVRLMLLGSVLLLCGVLRGQTFAWEKLDFAKDRAVQDFAGVIPQGDEAQLEARLEDFWRKTSIAVVVVTLKDLDGGDIQDAATRIYKKMGIGNAKTDKGVLLIAAIQDRKVWIEVGYGSEPILTDALASQIYRNDIVPAFRAGNYPAGIGKATGDIMRVLSGDELAKPAPQQTSRQHNGAGGLGILGIILFFFIIRAIFGGRGGGGIGRGRGGGLLTWLVLSSMMNNRRGGWGGGGGFGGSSGGFGGGGFSGGGFGGFGGGMSGGGGAGGGW